jgi:hypothetical protein
MVAPDRGLGLTVRHQLSLNRADGMLRDCEAASLPRGEKNHGSRRA